MDMQSRLVLEAAYQAVEQSGYFSELDHGHGLGQGTNSDSTNMNGKMHVGVYLGSCGVDYGHNISYHKSNAFRGAKELCHWKGIVLFWLD